MNMAPAFQYPGLNNLYYKYKCQKAKENADFSTSEGSQVLTDAISKAYRASNIRMTIIFLCYLQPLATALIMFFALGIDIFGFAIVYELAFIAVNFCMDARYRNVVESS